MNILSKRPDPLDARYTRAFTLIELLVVIAIIGLLAGLVIPLAGIATTKMRLSRVQAELNRYASAIETYKLETGEYPQDNGLLRNMDTSRTNDYKTNAARNPLYYELTGAIFTNAGGPPRFVTIQRGDVVTASDLQNAFDVSGVRNSARVKSDIDYKGFNLKNAQFEQLRPLPYINNAQNVQILVVPVPGPIQLQGGTNSAPKMVNPWFYDASSTNRNNKSSFDLWAEIFIGGKTQVVANWKM